MAKSYWTADKIISIKEYITICLYSNLFIDFSSAPNEMTYLLAGYLVNLCRQNVSHGSHSFSSSSHFISGIVNFTALPSGSNSFCTSTFSVLGAIHVNFESPTTTWLVFFTPSWMLIRETKMERLILFK